MGHGFIPDLTSQIHVFSRYEVFVNLLAKQFTTSNQKWIRSTFYSVIKELMHKGLAKLGNIVADTNVSQLRREGNMCC